MDRLSLKRDLKTLLVGGKVNVGGEKVRKSTIFLNQQLLSLT